MSTQSLLALVGAAATIAGVVVSKSFDWLLDRLRDLRRKETELVALELSEGEKIRAELRGQVDRLTERVSHLEEENKKRHEAYLEVLQAHGRLEIAHRKLRQEHDELGARHELVKNELELLRAAHL